MVYHRSRPISMYLLLTNQQKCCFAHHVVPLHRFFTLLLVSFSASSYYLEDLASLSDQMSDTVLVLSHSALDKNDRPNTCRSYVDHIFWNDCLLRNFHKMYSFSGLKAVRLLRSFFSRHVLK